jgi:outer membrane murein-binding lipoprotein Lpp
MKNLNKFVLMIAAALVITGCSNPKSSSEYKSLKSDVDGLQAEVDALQIKVDSANILTKKLDDIKKERNVLLNNFSTLISVPSRKSAVINKFALPACKSFAYASFDLRGKYDDDTSTTYQAELEKIIGAKDYAWSALRSTSDDDPQGLKQYITELDFMKCYKSNYVKWFTEKCETFDRLLLKKDTNSYIGKCLKGTVKIAQSDSATGTCAFQGYISGDYDVRAQFGTTLDTATHAIATDCSDSAKKLTEGRFVEFWGFVLGSYTYTTTNNGSQTVPAFKILATR